MLMKRFSSMAALTAFLLTAAACGSDTASPSTTEAPETTAAAETTAAPETTEAPEYPSAIVSLSPTATEMLFAIGAGAQVIAVDDYSNYPAEALEKPHDLSGFEPNVEAIAALSPDLVVMQDDTIKAQLEDLGIAVWVGPAAATFDDVYTQIEQLGAATGHVAEAAELVLSIQGQIDAAVAAVGETAQGVRVYHELDPTLYSLTSNTFAGQVYALFGATNIADGAQEGNDYPQLNAEYIVGADPTLIVLADGKCCGESAETVSTRPGWDALTAVANGDIVVIDDDIASRWGPRIAEFVTAVGEALAKVAAA
jgi:iron complex transport system substrate-binding protein